MSHAQLHEGEWELKGGHLALARGGGVFWAAPAFRRPWPAEVRSGPVAEDSVPKPRSFQLLAFYMPLPGSLWRAWGVRIRL